MNLGVIIVLIAALGYLSNRLNWRYLDYEVTRLLYYVGTFVHETSHALLCIATGARIEKFQVFSSQPQVIHGKSKLPIIGQPLISFAPIAGGLLFLFLVNHYLLQGYFILPSISVLDWQDILAEPLRIILQIDLFQWQSWVMILLFVNVGAMLGPSMQDLKNIWPVLIILFFVSYAPFAHYGLIAISFIFINIALQAVLILGISLLRRVI